MLGFAAVPDDTNSAGDQAESSARCGWPSSQAKQDVLATRSRRARARIVLDWVLCPVCMIEDWADRRMGDRDLLGIATGLMRSRLFRRPARRTIQRN
jgi:hypothetical protein